MTPAEQDPARELVARAIREATDTELDDCLDDEDACFERKIHLGAATNGVVRTVYATPEMIADVAVAALAEAGRLLPAGGREERTQWRVEWPDDGDFVVSDSRASLAEAVALRERWASRDGAPERAKSRIVARRVITFDWVEVGTDER